MLTRLGVLRKPHIGSGREPVPGQRVRVLDEKIGRRPAVRPGIEVRLDAKMNLRTVKGDAREDAGISARDRAQSRQKKTFPRERFSRRSRGNAGMEKNALDAVQPGVPVAAALASMARWQHLDLPPR